MTEVKKILIFGAGKIGRSFIGQLFSQAGYRLVFIEADPKLVNALQERRAYRVVFLDSIHPEREESIEIGDIDIYHVQDEENVLKQILDADILATSVGKRGLIELSALLAKGIQHRYNQNPKRPLDIIMAENIPHAASLLWEALTKNQLDVPPTYIGLVATSIGKMVPLVTSEQDQADPLAVYAEPYNNLILDGQAFRNPVPKVHGLSPKQNMKAWVDRKFFIHNMGHASLAYQANYHYPELVYTWEALEINALQKKIRATMLQSADILLHLYPGEFDIKEMENHVDDILERFANRALGDTIFRVGCDLKRKLSEEDRLLRPVLAGIRLDLPFDLILEAWIKGCSFRATGENGEELPGDKGFKMKYGLDYSRILEEHCHIKPTEIPALFNSLNRIKPIA